ncbi:MAG: hypothetical protein RIE85_06400 [Alcanivorax sp.]
MMAVAGFIAVAFAVVCYATGIAIGNAVTVAVLLTVRSTVAVGIRVFGIIVMAIRDAVAIAVVIRERVRLAVIGLSTATVFLSIDHDVIRARAVRRNRTKLLAVGVVVTAVLIGVFIERARRLPAGRFAILIEAFVLGSEMAVVAIRAETNAEGATLRPCPPATLITESR